MTSQYKDLTNQHIDLVRRNKDLASGHNYLTSGGRNMPQHKTMHMANFLLTVHKS